MKQNETFSIRQMVELTGLSEFTIRGWENRYSAFVPLRGKTGRRQYSRSDVEKALLLRELIKRGQRISKVASLNQQKLQELFESTHTKKDLLNTERSSREVLRALDLMALQKWEELEHVMHSVQQENASQLIQEFFLPLIHLLSTNVRTGWVSISQEHIISSFIKEKIYSALSAIKTKKSSHEIFKKTRFVLAAPEGDHHEIGLLLAHLLIRSYGFRTLYLGPHTPAYDLSETTLRFDASHVLIVATVSFKEGARQDTLGYLSAIKKRIGNHSQILIAGNQAPFINQESKSLLLSMASFQDLENYLQQLEGSS